MFRVVRDTREKERAGWVFEESNICLGTTTEKLTNGDYTVEGLENELCIERKGSVGEWAGNLVEKRFGACLERMRPIKNKFIILEFELKDILYYPHNMPYSAQKNIKTTGAFLLRRTTEIQLEYGVQIIFAGKSGKEYALSLMKRAYGK